MGTRHMVRDEELRARPLFGRITPDGRGGGVVGAENPEAEARLLRLTSFQRWYRRHCAVPELVEVIRDKIREVASLHD